MQMLIHFIIQYKKKTHFLMPPPISSENFVSISMLRLGQIQVFPNPDFYLKSWIISLATNTCQMFFLKWSTSLVHVQENVKFPHFNNYFCQSVNVLSKTSIPPLNSNYFFLNHNISESRSSYFIYISYFVILWIVQQQCQCQQSEKGK